MRVLITGAAGMIGQKLAARLARDGNVAGTAISRLTLADVVKPELPPVLSDGRSPVAVEAVALDLTAAASGLAWEASSGADILLAGRPDLIFHLAAIVSGEAELDFEKGYRVNLDGTRALLDATRRTGGGYRPKFVFASSIAVFGAPFPDPIPDDFTPAPLTSYGAQKAICELLLADYTRRGFLDGIGIRLPSIVVRPGKPNKAASGFFSSIIREPLAGAEAVLPVPEDVRHWFASPRAAVGFLIHAAALAGSGALGARVNLTMPGLCCTVGAQIAALARIAGPRAAARIRREPDPLVARIVAGWPQSFDARRAAALGFRADSSFEEIIRTHIEDECGGIIAE